MTASTLTEPSNAVAARPLTRHRALVTGGSRGIGAACALRLARLGADVVITYRSSTSEAQQVLDACRREGATAEAVQADLGPDQPGQAIVDAATQAHRHYDIVVDSAPAPFPRVPLPQADADALADKARMDVAALHRLCQAFAPGMLERDYGRFIVISSGASWGATAPGLAAHGIAKGAQEAYVRYAATELLHGATTINALQLGFVHTQASSPVPPAARDLLAAATPAGRVANPDDIAGVVGLLAQPESGWASGIAIPVTGGMNYPLNLAALHPTTHQEA